MSLGVLSAQPAPTCADASYRRQMPHRCGGPLLEQAGALYLCAFTPYRQSPACQVSGLGATECKSSLGLQRTNPLPTGRYWIDVVGAENIDSFLSLMNDGKNLGVIKLENVETTEPGLLDRIAGSAGEKRAFVIFHVLQPGAITLNFERFGYPTIAAACVKSEEDTAQAPDIEKPGIPTWVYVAGAAVVGLFVLNATSNVAKAVTAYEEHK